MQSVASVLYVCIYLLVAVCAFGTMLLLVLMVITFAKEKIDENVSRSSVKEKRLQKEREMNENLNAVMKLIRKSKEELSRDDGFDKSVVLKYIEEADGIIFSMFL